MQFGLLSYSTTNLGDEIQSIAAARFLPPDPILVDRDQLNAPDIPPCKLILNGWHTHRPENWPPSPNITPLLTSFHLTNEVFKRNINGINPTQALLSGANLEYLKQHGAVGARDTHTRDLLLKAGVDAYFSGCLTLTLGDGTRGFAEEFVCACDLPPKVLAALKALTPLPVVECTPMAEPGTFKDRMEQARKLLALYANAACVVTTRLHCALPCLAMGTPVTLIDTAPDQYRFSGLKDLVRSCAPWAFIAGSYDFDIEDHNVLGDRFHNMRAGLIEKVCTFAGTPPSQFATRPPSNEATL